MLGLGTSELGCSSARRIQQATIGVSTSMAVTAMHNARSSRGDLRLAFRNGQGHCVRFSGDGEGLKLVGDLMLKGGSVV